MNGGIMEGDKNGKVGHPGEEENETPTEEVNLLDDVVDFIDFFSGPIGGQGGEVVVGEEELIPVEGMEFETGEDEEAEDEEISPELMQASSSNGVASVQRVEGEEGGTVEGEEGGTVEDEEEGTVEGEEGGTVEDEEEGTVESEEEGTMEGTERELNEESGVDRTGSTSMTVGADGSDVAHMDDFIAEEEEEGSKTVDAEGIQDEECGDTEGIFDTSGDNGPSIASPTATLGDESGSAEVPGSSQKEESGETGNKKVSTSRRYLIGLSLIHNPLLSQRKPGGESSSATTPPSFTPPPPPPPSEIGVDSPSPPRAPSPVSLEFQCFSESTETLDRPSSPPIESEPDEDLPPRRPPTVQTAGRTKRRKNTKARGRSPRSKRRRIPGNSCDTTTDLQNMEDGNMEFQVDSIKDCNVCIDEATGVKSYKYFVGWIGYSEIHDSWVHETDFPEQGQMFEEFWSNNKALERVDELNAKIENPPPETEADPAEPFYFLGI